MSEHPYVKKDIPPPPLEEGELKEIDFLQVKPVEGEYGPQYEFNGVIKGHGYLTRSWVKIHPQLRTGQKLGKLCLLVEKHVGRVLSGHEEAMQELQKIGVFFEVTGFRQAQGKTYPKFSVYDKKLPGTQKKIDIETPEIKAQKIVKYLSEKTDYTEQEIEVMVATELENSGNLFGVDMAAILVARTLKVNLENTGIKVS